MSQSKTCHYCDKLAVSSYVRRLGKIPAGYDIDPAKNPDKTSLEVVKVCEEHKR